MGATAGRLGRAHGVRGSDSSAAWRRLERLDARERASLVPVLGAGFGAQVIAEARGASSDGRRAVKRVGPALDWISLLLGVFRAAGAPRAESTLRTNRAAQGAATLVWDAAVTELAEARHVRASIAERQLRLRVRDVLDDALDARTRGALDRTVADFFDLGFQDALSFSFDRLLVARAAHANRLRASVDLVGVRGPTRVWLPHGHASAPGTIVLGARAYGTTIPTLERAFSDLRARARRGRGHAGPPRSWVDLATERPLVFLGLSMTPSEWTLWWTLAQRARRWARTPGAPPAFVLVRRDRSSEAFRALEAAAGLVGLELLECDTWDQGWARVRGALAQRRAR